MDIEKELREIDFSGLSKIKESLFQKLMADRAARIELDMDEMEYATAAGLNHIPKPDDNIK